MIFLFIGAVFGKVTFLSSYCLYMYIENNYTISSVTGSGHVKYKRNSLACMIHENSAYNIGDSACNTGQWPCTYDVDTVISGHVFYMLNTLF